MNTGIPGLGLYSRERVAPPARRPPSIQGNASTPQKAVAQIADDGRLTWTKEDGSPLPPEWEILARKQKRENLIAFLGEQAEERNKAIEALGRLHEHCPDPRERPTYRGEAFEELEPQLAPAQDYTFFDRFFQARRERVDTANTEARNAHVLALAEFVERERRHESTQRGRKLLYEQLVLTDLKAMETVLEERLLSITHIS